jgi:hypothetical protein
MADGHDMGVVREDFEGNRVNVFSHVIFSKVELDEVLLLQRFAIRWIRIMFQQPAQDVLVVEYYAFESTNGSREWLQAKRAEVVG